MSVVSCLRVREMLSTCVRPLIWTLKKCDDVPFQLPGTLPPEEQLRWIRTLIEHRRQSTSAVLLVGVSEDDLPQLVQMRDELQRKGFEQLYLFVGGLRGWMLHQLWRPEQFAVEWLVPPKRSAAEWLDDTSKLSGGSG